MAIEKSPLREADLILRNNFPPLNEDSYRDMSVEQNAAANTAAEATAAVTNASNVVAENMEGLTANAANTAFEKHATALSEQHGRHVKRAVNVALISHLTSSTKSLLNGTVSQFSTEWEALKVKAMAEDWDQSQFNAARDALVQEYQQRADQIGGDFTAAKEQINEAIKNDAEPVVPPTMNTASGPDAPGLPDNLPPEVSQQLQQLLGQLPGTAASAGQAAAGTISGLVSNPPGAALAQQGMQSLMSAVEGGGSADLTSQLDEVLSGPGDAGATLASGGAPTAEGASGGGGGAEGGEGGDAGQHVHTPGEGGEGGTQNVAAKPDAVAGGGADSAAEAPTASAPSPAPSPAAEPVTGIAAAEPSVPSTHLSSGDAAPSGTSSGMSPTGAGAPMGMPAEQAVKQQNVQSAPVVDAGQAGTELSAGTTAPTGPSGAAGLGTGSALSAAGAVPGMTTVPGAVPGGLSPAGTPVMGPMGPMGGGANLAAGMPAAMGATPIPVTPGILAPTPPAAAPAPAGPAVPGAPGAPAPGSAASPAQVQAGGSALVPAGTPGVTPVVPGTGITQAPALSVPRDPNAQQISAIAGIPTVPTLPANPGAVHHPSSPYTLEQKAAGTVLATLMTEFGRGGLATPIAVALLADGTTVFTTTDGLGFVPHGTRLPENTVPLSEFPSIGALFRTDMTGCTRPGYVLKLAADLGLVPAVRAIVATDSVPCDGVAVITTSALTGAPYMSTPVTRDLLSRINDEDVALALESLKQAWGFEPEPQDSETMAESVEMNIAVSRWDTVNNPAAVSSFAEYLLTDAEQSLSRGEIAEAAYVLRQLLHMTSH